MPNTVSVNQNLVSDLVSNIEPKTTATTGKDRGNRLIELGAIGLAAVGAVSAVAWAVCNAAAVVKALPNSVVKSLPNSIVSYVAENYGIPVEEGYFTGQVDSQNQPLEGILTYSDVPCYFDGQFVEGVASQGEMRCKTNLSDTSFRGTVKGKIKIDGRYFDPNSHHLTLAGEFYPNGRLKQGVRCLGKHNHLCEKGDFNESGRLTNGIVQGAFGSWTNGTHQDTKLIDGFEVYKKENGYWVQVEYKNGESLPGSEKELSEGSRMSDELVKQIHEEIALKGTNTIKANS